MDALIDLDLDHDLDLRTYQNVKFSALLIPGVKYNGFHLK